MSFRIYTVDIDAHAQDLKREDFAGFTPDPAAKWYESVRGACEDIANTRGEGGGACVMLAFKGEQIDEETVWSPVDDEYVLGVARWSNTSLRFTPSISAEVEPEGAGLDAALHQIETRATEAINTITRRLRAAQAFRVLLRSQNPRRMLNLLHKKGDGAEDDAAVQILAAIGLLGMVEGPDGLEPGVEVLGLDVIELANTLARHATIEEAAEEIEAGIDEVELDHT
jgi:hypothetical protein